MNLNLFTRSRLHALPLAIIAECARFFKVSFIVGSKAAFFSLGHCVAPLIGFYSGVGMAIGAFVVKSIVMGCSLDLAPSLIVAYHIPTLCAALYLATIAQKQVTTMQRALMAAGIISCFAAFGLHTVGSQAFVYTLFWLIPLCSTLIPHSVRFFHALAATFTAHAVGSVIWLYTLGPVTPAAWIALIPVVIVERLLFASGMTFSMALISAAHKAMTASGKAAQKLSAV